MRKVLIAMLMAVGLLAPAVIATQAVDTPKAEAYVTHQWRREIGTYFYIYDVQILHHDNGVTELNAWRYDYSYNYIGHALHAEAYDYVCFAAIDQGNYGSVYIASNGASDHTYMGVTNSCGGPQQTVNPFVCLPYYVYSRNATFYGYNPSGTQCPYSGAGHMGFDALAPLREEFNWGHPESGAKDHWDLI